MSRSRISPVLLEQLKERTPLSELVGRSVTFDARKSQPGRGDFWACCPFHGEATPSFHVDDRRGVYKCFGCGASGDHFSWLQEHDGLTFLEAVRALGGDLPEASPQELAEAERQMRQRRAEKAAQENRFREDERRRAYAIWLGGGRVGGTEGADYLRGRGLLPCPVRLPLRVDPHMPYWHQRKVPGEKKSRGYVLFSGPAMLAPITGPDGHFLAVHITWVDPFRPGHKMQITDPDTGEALPSKKVRGSVRGAAIRLHDPAEATRLVIGEGIETTLSVLLAELEQPLFARTAYWTSISLQHMGGGAAESVPHPTLLTKAGRPARVPGPVPDMDDERALLLPERFTEVLRLGDGDSDRFTAEQVMARADARWARSGRVQRTAWAPEGQDFNDVLREELQGEGA